MDHTFKAIAELDLEPIKVKLMDRESGHGWTLARANAVELEYRRFLCIMKKYPHEPAIPLQDVDQFWHFHILDTMKYAADCEAVFGYFLHHFPYIGMRGDADRAAHRQMAERTSELYAATFQDDYVHSSARAALAATPAPAWCGVVEPDTAAARCGVVEPDTAAAWCGVSPGERAPQPDALPPAFFADRPHLPRPAQ